jgi:[NiFe] hydrogenase assembly HybE family chaperone
MDADVALDRPARDAAAIAVGDQLVRLYDDIARRSMHDLPVYNAKLGIEAVGFHDDGVRVVGIVATPWFMNVVVTASPLGPPAVAVPLGASITHDLPSGAYDFVVGDLAGFGRLDSLSLFSPMFRFEDPDAVRATAEAAMVELMRPPAPTRADTPAPAPTALDRRALLFGRRPRGEAPTP